MADSPRAWNACRGWLARHDGLTSEVFILGIPEDSLDRLVSAIRTRASVKAAFGREGIESFSTYDWIPDFDDDELIFSTFFIAVHEGLRLQHFLGPSRPQRPGPWMAAGAGSYDLEIAFWPDEVFPRSAGGGEHERSFALLVRYALELRAEAGGFTVCLTHACNTDPRLWLAYGGGGPCMTIFP
jgi:hypothetical protein